MNRQIGEVLKSPHWTNVEGVGLSALVLMVTAEGLDPRVAIAGLGRGPVCRRREPANCYPLNVHLAQLED